MSFNLDDLDQAIIDELRQDGRLPNTEIARRLGVSEGTIRNRIQRLIGEGVLQIVAVANLSHLGYKITTVTGVTCSPGCTPEVAGDLSQIPGVRSVQYVTGRYDLLVRASFHSDRELLATLNQRIGKVPGVVRTETMHVLGIAKSDYDQWQPIEDD